MTLRLTLSLRQESKLKLLHHSNPARPFHLLPQIITGSPFGWWENKVSGVEVKISRSCSIRECTMSPFILRTHSQSLSICLFVSFYLFLFKQAEEGREDRVEGKKLVQTSMTLLTMQTALCKCHFITKVSNCEWWLCIPVSHKKWMGFNTSEHGRWRHAAYTPSHSHWHPLCTHGEGGGPRLLPKPVKPEDVGLSILLFVFAGSVWGNRSMCSVFSCTHICLRSCVNMMYEAVCRAWAKKNGALHHLASHCQTRRRHYTSQKYQAHPRLSNFAICWQCLHGGWFVITNSGAKINKLIYDPSCICTMKMPLVM